MNSKQEVTIEIERLDTIGNVVKAYQDIASSRIQRLRSSVVKNRDFMTELNEIFQQVKKSYDEEIKKLMKETNTKNSDDFSVILKNGKRACVYISANTGLYGSIVRRTFDLFMKETEQPNTDFIIIGKLGKRYFEQETQKSYTYFDFPDDQFKVETAKQIVDILLAYETVIIYHGIFNNIISQSPIASNISGDELMQIQTQSSAKKDDHWIIEPSLYEVLKFFETEIFSSLLTQSIQESQLAKFGSRLLSLTDSSESIKTKKMEATLEKVRIRHFLTNKKQLNALNGMMLWKIR